MKYCSINGKRAVTLDINDRGLAYGDGLFTTAKIIDGRVELLEQHVKRLIAGCNKLSIAMPVALSNGDLSEEIIHLAQQYTIAVLKVVITAGSGGRGYSRIGLNSQNSNIIVMIFDYPDHYNALIASGVTLGVSQQKMAISSMLSGIKHLNRLEQVLLRKELDSRNEDDLVVTNINDQVIETTSANLFYWIDDRLYTPEIKFSGVDGLMRQFIIAHSNKISGQTVIVEKTIIGRLLQADAIFTCNSVTGVMPVNTFNKKALNIEPVQALRLKIEELLCD